MRDDKDVLCLAGDPIAPILAMTKKGQGTFDEVWALAAKGRPANTDQTSNHDEFAGLLTDHDIETLCHLVNEGMGENTLRALTSDPAYATAGHYAFLCESP